jgi:hypothetical protein
MWHCHIQPTGDLEALVWLGAAIHQDDVITGLNATSFRAPQKFFFLPPSPTNHTNLALRLGCRQLKCAALLKAEADRNPHSGSWLVAPHWRHDQPAAPLQTQTTQ